MKTTTDFRKMKKNGEKITMITAYDAPTARFVEDADLDLILVGDSVGMVVHGYENTQAVTLEDMLLHTRAVRRGAPSTFVVADMPFLSFHESLPTTVQNARRLIQDGGAQAVKLEGADELTCEAVKRLVGGGVPVMGHVGLTPQSVGVLGGFRVQGKKKESAKKILNDVEALVEAGAFAIVLECVPEALTQYLTERIDTPLIGIGAGAADGQVLVFHDLVDYSGGFVPRFAKRYVHVGKEIEKALAAYGEEVKAGVFPAQEHTFKMDKEIISELEAEEKES